MWRADYSGDRQTEKLLECPHSVLGLLTEISADGYLGNVAVGPADKIQIGLERPYVVVAHARRQDISGVQRGGIPGVALGQPVKYIVVNFLYQGPGGEIDYAVRLLTVKPLERLYLVLSFRSENSVAGTVGISGLKYEITLRKYCR